MPSASPLAPKLTLDLSGPFFKADITKTILTNAGRMMEGIAQEGERTAVEALSVGEGGREPLGANVSPSRASGHVKGRVRSLRGHPWAFTAVISINNVGFTPEQGIALMAGASEVEAETHAFARTAAALRQARAVLRANLTEGLE